VSREAGAGNLFAFLTLMCGITSWVPIIVVITAPLTFGFFVLAHVFARRKGHRGRLHAAWTGLALTLMALGLQVALAGVAALPGMVAAGCAG
jgi:small neutral amino acid transporter SnatA (MarC family)